MSENNLRGKLLSGLFWRYMERCIVQGVSFVVGIILARILTPDDYGLSSLSAIFVSIISVVADLGLTQALIQKKDPDELDFNSVYYVNIFISVAVYAIIFFSAPLAAGFYKDERITALVRVSSLTLPICSIFAIQSTITTKRMEFKKYFWVNIIGAVISSFIGIAFALNGLGVWAIVAQSMASTIVGKILLSFVVRWRPKAMFSFNRVKPLFNYGYKLLISRALDQIYNNIYSLIIGRVYTTSDLAYYNRGKQYPMYIINNINDSILSVMFPAVSSIQDHRKRVKDMVRRSIVTSTFFIFPMMMGLGVMAKPLIQVMITDKWLPAVPFLQFCCFTYAFWPIHTANLQAISALGRSDIFLKLEVIKKVIGVSVLILTIPHGLMVMMYARCVTTVISSFLNAYPNKKLLNYSYFEQLRDMMPSVILSVIMGVFVWGVSFIHMNIAVQIIIQFIVGVVVYLGLAKLFNLECLSYVINIVKNIVNEKKSKM